MQAYLNAALACVAVPKKPNVRRTTSNVIPWMLRELDDLAEELGVNVTGKSASIATASLHQFGGWDRFVRGVGQHTWPGPNRTQRLEFPRCWCDHRRSTAKQHVWLDGVDVKAGAGFCPVTDIVGTYKAQFFLEDVMLRRWLATQWNAPTLMSQPLKHAFGTASAPYSSASSMHEGSSHGNSGGQNKRSGMHPNFDININISKRSKIVVVPSLGWHRSIHSYAPQNAMWVRTRALSWQDYKVYWEGIKRTIYEPALPNPPTVVIHFSYNWDYEMYVPMPLCKGSAFSCAFSIVIAISCAIFLSLSLSLCPLPPTQWHTHTLSLFMSTKAQTYI